MKTAYSYKYYYDYIIKYDSINVFHYKKTQELPRLQKFVLSSNPLELSQFFCFYTFSRLLTSKPGKLKVKVQSFNTQKNKQKSISTVFSLKKRFMLGFLFKLFREVFPFKKSKIKLNLHKPKSCSHLIYKVDKLVSFDLMKNNYILFKKLEAHNSLNISLITNTKKLGEFVFLLCSYKLLQLK
jgi:hypothetical protein